MKLGVTLALCAGVVWFALGCGSSNTNSTSAAPGPSTATSSPAPGGSGTGGTGGGSSTAQIQYSAAIDDATSHSTGQITLDTTGKGALALKTTPSSTVAVNWCNYPGSTGCLSVGAFTSDSSGNVNAGFTFPAHGNFAGVFTLTAGTTQFSAGWNIPNGGAPFQALMLPAGSISAGLGQDGVQIGIGNDPIAGGSVTIAADSSIAHFVVQGALPNSNYPATFCTNRGSSSCFALGVLITDGSGNATWDNDLSKDAITPTTGLSGVFFLHRQTDPQHAPYEFVSGFKVP
jgi:hypothetical protein